MQNDQNSKTKSKKLWLIFLIVFGLAFLIVVVFFLGRYFSGKSLKITDKNTSPAPTLTTSPIKSPLNNPSPTASTVTTKTPPPQWLVFKNEDFGYQVFYPEGAEIIFADDTAITESGFKSKKVCVTIKTAYMHVTISAKENKDAKYICLKSGVSADEIPNEPEEITVMGKKYTASGFMFASASMGVLDSTWLFDIDDGTGFEYGISINPEKTADMKAETAHTIAKDIVESYQTF